MKTHVGLEKKFNYHEPLDAHSNIWKAWKIFKETNADVLPVAHDGKFIGVLLREDIDTLRRNYDLKQVRVIDFISKDYILLESLNEDVWKHVVQLAKNSLKAVVFAAKDSTVVGVLSIFVILESILSNYKEIL